VVPASVDLADATGHAGDRDAAWCAVLHLAERATRRIEACDRALYMELVTDYLDALGKHPLGRPGHA
jgi:hypothetical protein